MECNVRQLMYLLEINKLQSYLPLEQDFPVALLVKRAEDEI